MPLDPSDRRLVVIGDRVLISQDLGDERTETGLILPQAVAEKAQVQSGRVVAVGPGVPMPISEDFDEEPWRQAEPRTRHIPMQVREGDTAIFLRKATVEIKYHGQTYLIVPQSAILVLLRDDEEIAEEL